MHYLVHIQKEREEGKYEWREGERMRGRRLTGGRGPKGKGRIEGEERGGFLATSTQVYSSYRKQASLLYPHCKAFPPGCSLYFKIVINLYLYSKSCSIH